MAKKNGVSDLLGEKKIAGYKSIVFSFTDEKLGNYTFEFKYKELDAGFIKKKIDAEGKEVKTHYIKVNGLGEEVKDLISKRVDRRVDESVDPTPVGEITDMVVDTLKGKQVKSLGDRILKPLKIVPKSMIGDFVQEKIIKLWTADNGSFLLAQKLGQDECVACHFQAQKGGLLYMGFMYPKIVHSGSSEDSQKLIWLCVLVLRRLDDIGLYPEAQAITSIKEYADRMKQAESMFEGLGVI